MAQSADRIRVYLEQVGIAVKTLRLLLVDDPEVAWLTSSRDTGVGLEDRLNALQPRYHGLNPIASEVESWCVSLLTNAATDERITISR